MALDLFGWEAVHLTSRDNRLAELARARRTLPNILASLSPWTAIVVSQEGGVQFGKQLDGRVAYWGHASIGVR